LVVFPSTNTPNTPENLTTKLLDALENNIGGIQGSKAYEHPWWRRGISFLNIEQGTRNVEFRSNMLFSIPFLACRQAGSDFLVQYFLVHPPFRF